MILFLLTILFCILLVDIVLVGFLPSKFNLWGSYRDLGIEKQIIKDSLLWAKTNLNRKFVDSMINKRVGYKYALLTEKGIVLKNTMLTYLLFIDIKDILSVKISKQNLVNIFEITIKDKDETKFFKFATSNSEGWMEEFKLLGVEIDNP